MTEQITRKSLFRVIAWILVFCMMLTIFPLGARAEGATTQSVQRTTITDPATNSPTDYVDILGAADSTQYDGRVWVDKTVSDKNVEFTGDADTKTFSVSKDEDEDFLVTYSALANTANIQINPEEQISDTIFVLDFSMTMNCNMDGMNPSFSGLDSVDEYTLTATRIYAMLKSLEDSIYNLKQANPNNRVGIVTFYGTTDVLLPLTKVSDIQENVTAPTAGTEMDVTGTTRKVNYTTPRKYFSLIGYGAYGDGVNLKSWVQCNIAASPAPKELAGYTNLQGGLYEGLKMLRSADSKPENGREANVIVISDGSSNAIAAQVENTPWYKDMNPRKQVTGDYNVAQAFAIGVTAAYIKEEMKATYKDCSIYTVGLTTASNKAEMERFLNPGKEIDSNSYWLEYKDNDGFSPKMYGVTFDPATDVDGDIIPSSLQYADAFYDADNADALADAFQKITAEIISGAKAPTDVPEGESPETSGYITFTDPLGEYMAVKDVKCIIFDDYQFTEKETTTADNKTTYTFTGTVDNPVYRDANVEDIIIEVSETDGQQTLTIKIPASVLPLRSNTVFLNSEDPASAWKMTTEAHMPMRIVYSLGLQEGVTADTIDEAYLADKKDGTSVHFYTNLYDGANKAEDSQTLGNATATFTAGSSNPFYYAPEGAVLYTAENGTLATGTLDENTTYYVKHDYYYMKAGQIRHGTDWTALTGLTAADVKSETVENADGTTSSQLVLAKAQLKNVNLQSARSQKAANTTNTAAYSYYAQADTAATGSFLAYLGNNGRLSLPLPEPATPLAISVQKDWDDADNQDGLRPASVTVTLLADGTATNQTLTLSEANNWQDQFTIADPQENVTYSVQEASVEGYTSTITGTAAEGFTITNTHTSAAPPEEENPGETNPPAEEEPDIPDWPDVPADPDTPDEPEGPTEPDDPSIDLPDDLNTVDHFSYIVGYPEDYRTGETTDDEDLWPVKPQNNITRAEVASIFYRLLKEDVRDENTTDVSDFSDVKSSDWYGTTVATLADMGIVKGYEDGTFRPNAPITRAEFAAIATRFFEETGATYEPGTFTDVVGNEWFAGAIADAVNLGLIGGYEDGTVRPNNNITRAEACAIVNRTLGRVPDADHLLPEDEMKIWPDNPESAWFYADMQEATNGHEYEWITEDGNKIENWTDLLDKDWNDR